ncbi:hypothetical protein ACFLTZ_06845 [Chloroflexota bacterium]
MADYWTDDGIYVCGGRRFGLSANLRTVVVTEDSAQNNAEVNSAAKKAVSKISDHELLPTPTIQAQVDGIMKQRGRPRKAGDLSRVTIWRRARELQRSLL